MNQVFYKSTLRPFIDIFLENFEKRYKESGRNFEEFFEEYFAEDSTRKMAMKNEVIEISKTVNGNGSKLYEGVKEEEIASILVKWIRNKKLQSETTADFIESMFVRGESNTQRVKENRRLFALTLDNTALKLIGAQKERKYSDAKINRFKKLMKKVLGEARYQSLKNQVFIGNNKMFISEDLELELESAFQMMIETQLENENVNKVDFNISDLSIEAEIETKDGKQTVIFNGDDEIKLDIQRGERQVRLKGVEAEVSVKITKAPTIAKINKPELPKIPKLEEENLFDKSFEAREKRSDLDKSEIPYTKFPQKDTTNFGTTTQSTERRQIRRFGAKPLSVKRGVFVEKGPQKIRSGNLDRKFEAHTKAERFRRTNEKQGKPGKNPKDARTNQSLNQNESTANTTSQNQNGNREVTFARRKKAGNTMFKRILIASTVITGTPIVGGLGLGTVMDLTSGNSDPAQIASIVDGAHSIMVNIINFFIV